MTESNSPQPDDRLRRNQVLRAVAVTAAVTAITAITIAWVWMVEVGDLSPRPPAATTTVTASGAVTRTVTVPTVAPTRTPSETPTKSPTETPSETLSETPFPTSEPTGVPTGSDTSAKRLKDRAKRELTDGLVAYDVPDRVRVQEEVRVTARIQRGTVTVRPPLKSLPVIEQLPVGTYMRANLGGAFFDVEPLGQELQALTDDGFAEWAWTVKARSAGSRSLRLTLYVELDQEPLSQKTFDRVVDVRVEEQPGWLAQFIGWDPWENVVSAVLGAAFLELGRRGLRRWWPEKGKEATADGGSAVARPGSAKPARKAPPVGQKKAAQTKPQLAKPGGGSAKQKPPRSKQ